MSFIDKGWATEIRLVESWKLPQCDFYSFFHPESERPIHHTLPYNPKSAYLIFNTFDKFKESMIQNKPTFYPRHTHKNMSRSTRLHFEEVFDVSLDDIPIFGQDDWMRVYHEIGLALDGDVEMRQKWYPSQAKPRTYFAMGGKTYRFSRHLQDFFGKLVDAFPPTNHITRLRPERLRLMDEDEHYLIYDLSSFTSNCTEQRSFMNNLAEFMSGVEVNIWDEHVGLLQVDLGDLLRDYNIHCVDAPVVSMERVPERIRSHDVPVEHGSASMLGIFGNLMTCTLTHFLILSTLIEMFDRINVAGDDGLVPMLEGEEMMFENAISLVGVCAPEKTMLSSDEGAVHLKRPISEAFPFLLHGENFVPPNIAVAATYLSGEDVDPRYQYLGVDEIPLGERISIVGKDLLRFLQSVYNRRETITVDLEDVFRVFRGFRSLVAKIIGIVPAARQWSPRELNYVWPVDPSQYDFLSSDPTMVYCVCCCSDITEVFELDVCTVDIVDFRFSGDVFISNSSKHLSFLETLGFLEKTERRIHLEYAEAVHHLYRRFSRARTPPVVYDYCVVKDIPDHMLPM